MGYKGAVRFTCQDNSLHEVKVIQLDMARDSGVQADYVDRAFRKDDDRLLAGAAKRAKLGATVLTAGDARREACEALEVIQASRPMKPPTRKL